MNNADLLLNMVLKLSGRKTATNSDHSELILARDAQTPMEKWEGQSKDSREQIQSHALDLIVSVDEYIVCASITTDG